MSIIYEHKTTKTINIWRYENIRKLLKQKKIRSRG